MKENFKPSGFELRLMSNSSYVECVREPFLVENSLKNLVCNRFNDKFLGDKIFKWVGDYFIILNGVVTNRAELECGDFWPESIFKLIEKYDFMFPSKLKGSFSGAYFKKSSKTWVLFCDHIGSKPIFYSKNEHITLVSTHAASLYESQGSLNRTSTLCEQACYMLLTYGFMLDNYTLDENVKKVSPGSVLIIDEDNNITEKRHFILPENYDTNIDIDEAIEEIDNLFSKAVKLQFDKDISNNYKNLVALSGGLDSRMTTWVGHKLGFKNQLNFTYSQKNYLDETIASDIANNLGHEWIFKSLNNGVFLKDLESCNNVSSGLGLSYGIGQGLSLHRYLNFDEFGIVHSGHLGDVIIGSYIKDSSVKLLSLAGLGADSKKLINKVIPYKDAIADKMGVEHFMMNQRGFNGINVGTMTSGFKTETISPFCDPELIKFSLSIRPEHRIGHKLYKQWITKYHSGAAEYIWEAEKRKINNKAIKINYKGRDLPLKSILPMVMSKLGLKKNGLESGEHMNPVTFWYNNDVKLQNYSQSIFEKFKNKKISSELMSDCIFLLENGNGVEKNAVYTLANAVNKWFK